MTECDWCKRDWETCATCESFFNREARCYSEPGEIGCAHYKPFGFCPKCGRKLKVKDNG